MNGTIEMYYVSKVSLRNIKCLPEEVTFTVPIPSTDRPSWTLVLGDNGTGKTTILRCIALALCDEITAPALLSRLRGKMIRTGRECAEIEVELKSTSTNATKFTKLTTLQKMSVDLELIEQVMYPDGVDIHKALFACGYGSSYGTIGNELYNEYRLMDAVYTLFNYNIRLQNPEVVLFRISEYMHRHFSASHDATRRRLFEKIEPVLMLEPGSLTLDSRGLQASGFWGDSVPVSAIGDGHAATLNWICDLLAWTLLANRGSDDIQPRGIVLLDEIEKRMHPSWQRQIVNLLSQSFPHIQFIATTQAPLIATGTATLPEGCCRLFRLANSENGVEMVSGLGPPRGLRADQVLTSELFGLLATTSDDAVQKIERYAALSSKFTLTESECKEVRDLQADLYRTFDSAETPLQCQVEEAITKAFRELATGSEVDESVMKLEMRRQLRELCG